MNEVNGWDCASVCVYAANPSTRQSERYRRTDGRTDDIR